MSSQEDDLAVENFRAYVRIPTISNKTDYEDCVKFLQKQACAANLQCTIFRVKPDKPVVIMKWPGTDNTLPSIVLNSHMDVVPAEEDKWDHPPFEAFMDNDGKIYGRGTQDNKSIGMQYLEAIRRLKRDKVQMARTIYVLFMPDEELGSQDSMKLFVQTPEFAALKIGFWLDESMASACPRGFILFYGEKHKWSVKFHVTGDVGHGSLNYPNTAGEKLAKLLNLIYTFRNEQFEKSGKVPTCTNVISLNATQIEGGLQENVIPSEFIVDVDTRLPPNVDIARWKNTLDEWCKTVGEGVRIEEMVCEILDKPTARDTTNPFYQPFVDTIREMGFEVIPMICNGATDARYVRNLGIPAFGLSVLNGIPQLAHKHNEYLDRERFLLGIAVYYKILPKMANLTF